MTVLRESPWYQEIRKEGEVRGLQLGRNEGIQLGEVRGLQLGKSSLILSQIRRKFGKTSPDLELKIGQFPLEKLDELGESLFDFSSMTDLISWLENN